MNTKRFIFCALDFTDLKKTLDFTEIIKNNVGGIKLGLEFFPRTVRKELKNEKVWFTNLFGLKTS